MRWFIPFNKGCSELFIWPLTQTIFSKSISSIRMRKLHIFFPAVWIFYKNKRHLNIKCSQKNNTSLILTHWLIKTITYLIFFLQYPILMTLQKVLPNPNFYLKFMFKVHESISVLSNVYQQYKALSYRAVCITSAVSSVIWSYKVLFWDILLSFLDNNDECRLVSSPDLALWFRG